MKRFHAVISGKVQGVYFRATARKQASALGIKGFIRNLPNGSVELEAQGEDLPIEEFLLWCHSGPPNAQVDKVCVNWKLTFKEEMYDFLILGG